MATINVSTTAELTTALSTAHAGDTILLAAGHYSGVILQNFNFATPVTITSADATHPATLTDLNVKASSGLNFTNLELDATGSAAAYAFQVNGSSNIDLSHLWVHGSLDGNTADDTNLLFIRGSSNVTVSASEFEQGKNMLVFLDNDHLQILGNSFHDIRTDAVHGAGSSNVTISQNSFRDFYPGIGAHPDAIQFLTSGETAGVHDIVITDNVIDRGSGSAVQGIFMTDQVGTLPYQNVTISGNMLVGTMYNGIMVNDGINLNISNNTVAGLPDMKSWIRVEGSTDAVLNHNIAATLVQTGNTNLSVTDFTNLLTSTDQSTQLLQTWLSQHGAVSSIYQNEQMWLAPVDTTSTSTSTSGGTSTTATGTTTGTSTGTTSTTSGSTGTTTGTTSGSTTGTSTGTTSGSTTGGTGHGGTKGHQVMHKLDQTSDLSTTKVITTAQASATTSIVASTSTQSGASKPLDHSSDHFDFAWSSPAKSLASIAVHHELDAHVQPALYAGQGSPVLPSSIHQNEWVHDFFAVHDHSLI